jgi:hypothetical protein
MTNSEYIQNVIDNLPEGTAFVISDFADKTSNDNVRQIFSRLESEGEIRRILPGIYDKPAYSEILNENAAPNPNNVAEAIARKNNWTITPSGNVALNLLGLSTQVPAKWEYISSGPSNEYQIENTKISFIHRADKEVSRMSRKTSLIIQAIKSLGKDQISNEIIRKITSKTTNEERMALLSEARQTTSWIYEVIKKISKKE